MTPVQKTKMSNFRWVICALLFLATTINYMDRQVLSLTWKDFIAPEFHWTDGDYGTITGMFSLFYAIANLFAGKFIDWMGTKKGYLIAIFGQEGPLFSTPSPAFIVCRHFDSSYSDWHEMVSHCGFDLHFFDNE